MKLNNYLFIIKINFIVENIWFIVIKFNRKFKIKINNLKIINAELNCFLNLLLNLKERNVIYLNSASIPLQLQGETYGEK